MQRSPIVPCLWFDDQAEDAADFYTRLFPAGRSAVVTRYPESFDNPGDKPRGSVLTVDFEIAGQRVTALNGGPQFAINPSISFFAHVDTPREAEQLFGALADEGQVLMPLGAYPWSECYGWVADRFGVSFQVISGRREPGAARLVPCLMFAGAQHGRAEAAIQLYTRVFPGSRIGSLERYAAGEGPTGSIKHGRFTLAGQELVAMDSHVEHGFGFNEGLSLQVMCDDQGELDRTWEGLSAEGRAGSRGWLKDAFGVSWQVAPGQTRSWLSAADAAAGERAFQAITRMRKLDIAQIQASFDACAPAER